MFPAITLILIAPLVAEILPGSAPISRPGLLPFLVLIYGPGALLIRDVVRSRGGGWTSILLLGAAYGLVEEGIALQSLFNPVQYQASAWGRIGSFNAVYAEAAIPIHAIWSAAVPILLTDLCFPESRRRPYLGRIGRLVTACWYGAGVVMLSLLARYSIAPDYRAAPLMIRACAAAALLLVVLAFVLPEADAYGRSAGKAPGPALLMFLAAVVGFLWHAIVAALWRIQPAPGHWPAMLVPMTGAAVLIAAAFEYLRRATSTPAWSDRHWLALAAGLVIAHSLFGAIIFARTAADRAGIAVLGSLLLVSVAMRVRAANASPPQS